ncbi:MAG: NIPSNAP family protein [Myxococcales bacterium]|nr:NIPSNAP family protein [Myxococcales bacterium]
MITCCVRYLIAPGKLKEFEEYARRWTKLIPKFGGTHHGYFLPDDPAGLDGTFSFRGLGAAGPGDVAMALYSFPDAAAYNAYRRMSAEDDECKAVTAFFDETRCFTSYERTFLKQIK